MSTPLVIAQGSEGSFLVSPGLGLMIWTLVVFGITLLILRRYAFPRIAEALDARRRAIEESIDGAERTRREADDLLAEYRERLREARSQAEDITARARKASDRLQDEAKEDARRRSDEMIARARKEIENETRRSLDEIRREVADLTVLATEKVTRKSLDGDDHKRLIDEALSEVDFAALAGGRRGRRERAQGTNGSARESGGEGEDTGGGDRPGGEG